MVKIEASQRLKAAEEGKKTFTFIVEDDKGTREVTVDAKDTTGAWIGLGLGNKDDFSTVKSATLKE